jgi:hypothetical protein
MLNQDIQETHPEGIFKTTYTVICDFCGDEITFGEADFKKKWNERTCIVCKKKGAPSQYEEPGSVIYEQDAKKYNAKARRRRRYVETVRMGRSGKADGKARRARRNRRRHKEQGSPLPSPTQS